MESIDNHITQKKISRGDPSRQPSVVEISDKDKDKDNQEKPSSSKPNEDAESSESELS